MLNCQSFLCRPEMSTVVRKSSYLSILLDWRSHLAKTLFIFHKYLKYIKIALFIENYLHFMKNCIRQPYEKLKPLKSGFIKTRILKIIETPVSTF